MQKIRYRWDGQDYEIVKVNLEVARLYFDYDVVPLSGFCKQYELIM